MKILFPIGLFYPASVGGPSNSVYWLAKYLASNGATCEVVTTDYKIPKSREWQRDKWMILDSINVMYCKTNSVKLPLKAIFQTLKAILRCDVVHYSSAYYTGTLFTLCFAILCRKKVILSPRGEFFQVSINSRLKRLVVKLYRLLSPYIFFHATSEDEVLSIRAIAPNSDIVIQSNFMDLVLREKSLSYSKDLVFVGIIYSVKKIENVIRALLLSDAFMKSGANFIIVGMPLVNRDIEYFNNLKALTAELDLTDRVKFCGELFGEEKFEKIQNSYLLILPSESENFGNVVVEAMSCSTPVIASKGTPWSILRDYKCGWWCDNEIVSIAETLEYAYNMSSEEYLGMSVNCISLVTEKYDINHSKENEWLSIYRKILHYE